MRRVAQTRKCQHCKGRSENAYLCFDDQSQLHQMLSDFPWLWEELQTTRTCQDRLSTGAVGKGSNPSPIRIGAMELAREAEAVLIGWTDALEDTGCKFLPAFALPYGVEGPLLPGQRRLPPGYSGTPPQRARWLAHHVADIARHEWAGDCYRDIAELVGDPDHPDTQPGRILLTVNRSERLFVGLCGTVRGHNSKGEAIECQNPLYVASADQQTVECGRCGSETNAIRLRSKSLTDRDLATETKLLSLLDDLGEPVSRVRFYNWLKEGKIVSCGYLHSGMVVPKKVRHADAKVFSISAVRALRAADTVVCAV